MGVQRIGRSSRPEPHAPSRRRAPDPARSAAEPPRPLDAPSSTLGWRSEFNPSADDSRCVEGTVAGVLEDSLTTSGERARAGAPDEAVISIRGLRKAYGDREAVRGIDLEVRRGEIFAFLGPNGAGKTTTVEILEGFRHASGGEISVLGSDPWHAHSSWRERIGIVLQE